MEAKEVFANELQKIQNPEIVDLVLKCFDELCPDYFWTVPCSTSGKYHPKVSLGVGGLIRHVKLAIWWGLELIRALGSSSELKDIPTVQLQDEVIAALLLHDMIKNGKGLDSNGRPFDRSVTGTHGVTLAKKMLDLDIHVDANGSCFRILAGIAGHMGIWTTDVGYQPENMEDFICRAFAKLIHLADYCASRKVDDMYSILEEKPNDTKNTTQNPGQATGQ